MKVDTLEALLEEELKDLYDAERQLVKALPKMAKAASSEELRNAFQEHLEVTKGQVERLEEVFGMLEAKPKAKPCAGMRGLIEEGQEIMQMDAEDEILDAALIGAAQKVEHYEISGYGSARSIADALGNEDVAELLQKSLDEEEQADSTLTQICEGLLESTAAMSGEDEEEEEEETTRGAAQAKTGKPAARGGSSRK